MVTVDLWRDNGPAYGENGKCSRSLCDLAALPQRSGCTGTYSAFLYTHEALRNIASHNVNTPMFMYLAYQNMHCPLQVPASYEIPSIQNEHLRLEDAMAHALDEGIGNVTSLLKSRGMWDDTILFFSVRPSSPASPLLRYPPLSCANRLPQADNGGPVHDPAGGCPGQSSSNNCTRIVMLSRSVALSVSLRVTWTVSPLLQRGGLAAVRMRCSSSSCSTGPLTSP